MTREKNTTPKDTTPPDHLETSQPRTVKVDAGDSAFTEETYIPKTSEESQASLPNNSADKTMSGSQLPENFGRYRIIKLLGEGAMGAVYLAEDTQLQRQVALKTPSFTGRNPELLERFYREARSVATLNNKHICTVFDVGEINETHYISMAYIEGRPLSDFINIDKIQPPKQVAKLIRKLSLALQEAHDAGVIHRDLKPDNIMVDTKGEPVIMDFGLARQTNLADARMTHSGAIMGTPAYMAPEQVRGEQDVIGAASDQYSLGVVLYQMLCGKRPFEGSIGVVMSQILNETPTSPSTIQTKVSPAIEAICTKMMQKKPADRYASMNDVAKALAKYLTQPDSAMQNSLIQNTNTENKEEAATEFPVLRTVAPSPKKRLSKKTKATKPKPLKKETSSKKFIYGIGAALLGLLLLAGIMFILTTPKGTVVIELDEGVADDIKIELTGGGKVQLAEKSNNWSINIEEGKYQIHLKGGNDRLRLDKQEVTVLRNQKEIVKVTLKPVVEPKPKPPETKPDPKPMPLDPPPKKPENPGTVEPFDPFKGKVAVSTPISIKGTAGEAGIFQYHKRSISAVNFSSDGKLVAAASIEGIVSIWGFPSGKHLQSLWFNKLSPCAVSFSKDSKSILVGYTTGEVHIWDLATGKIYHSFNGHSDWISRVIYSPKGDLIASASTSGSFRLWAINNQKELVNFPRKRGTSWGGDMAFLSDKRLLVSTREEGTRIFDVDSGKEIRRFNAKAAVRQIAISPDKKLLLTSSGKSILVWDIDGENILKNLVQMTNPDKKVLDVNTGVLNEFHFLPDGRHIAGITNTRRCYLWNVATGNVVARYDMPNSELVSLAVEPKGRFLVIGTQREQQEISSKKWENLSRCDLHFIRLPENAWLKPGYKPPVITPPTKPIMSADITKYTNHTSHGYSVAISPDSKTGMTAGYDQQVVLYDLETNKTKGILKLDSMGMDSQFSGDGKYILTSEKNGKIFLWQTKTKKKIRDLSSSNIIPYTRLFFTPDNKSFVLGGYGFWFRLFDTKTGRLQFEKRNDEKDIKLDGFALSKNGRFFASAGTSREVKIWDLKTGRNTAVLKGAAGTVRSIAFSADGKHLFAGGGSSGGKVTETIITMWDLSTKKLIQTFEGHRGIVYSLDVLPDGKHLISSSQVSKSVFVWDIKTGKKIGDVPYPGQALLRFTLSPDGNKILARDSNKSTYLLDISALKLK